MRTYLILKEKAEQFNADEEIQALLEEINADSGAYAYLNDGYSADAAQKLRDRRRSTARNWATATCPTNGWTNSPTSYCSACASDLFWGMGLARPNPYPPHPIARFRPAAG